MPKMQYRNCNKPLFTIRFELLQIAQEPSLAYLAWWWFTFALMCLESYIILRDFGVLLPSSAYSKFQKHM